MKKTKEISRVYLTKILFSRRCLRAFCHLRYLKFEKDPLYATLFFWVPFWLTFTTAMAMLVKLIMTV